MPTPPVIREEAAAPLAWGEGAAITAGQNKGGIPWGEWDAATRDTGFRGVVRVSQRQNRSSAARQHRGEARRGTGS